MQVWPGSPYPLGATYDGTGTNFALFSEVAERGRAVPVRRRPAPRRTGRRCPRSTRSSGTATCPASSPASATATGCTARTTRRTGCGATRTSCCSTRTPRRSTATIDWDPALFGYDVRRPGRAQRRPTPRRSCRSRSWSTRSSTGATTGRRDIPYHETVIYEAHVKGLTERHPDVPEELRGTYAGLAHPAMIEHLHAARRHRGRADAGAPVRPRPPRCVERGPAQLLGLQHDRLLRPAPRLLGRRGSPGSRCRSSRRWCETLHAAGIEVILDVVYNHTAEGNHLGPDAVDPRHRQRRVLPARRRTTGATTWTTPAPATRLNVRNPHTLQLIMDSLRYWVHRDARRRVPLRPRRRRWPASSTTSTGCRRSSTSSSRTRWSAR